MIVRRQLWFAAAALTGLCVATTARADAAGDAAVAAMDAAVNRPATLAVDYQVDNQEGPDRHARVMAIKLQTNGAGKLYEFTAPADMKGTKLLILSPTQMYIYLPAFGKVRRIASHARDQGFLGLAFSQDDFANTSFGAQYSGQIATQTPTQQVLMLTAKDQQTHPTPRSRSRSPKTACFRCNSNISTPTVPISRPKPVRTMLARVLSARQAK
jgi:Outer membrane lipoprotein-sorting protein